MKKGYIGVYETKGEFPDYLICCRCGGRVERGIANVSSHLCEGVRKEERLSQMEQFVCGDTVRLSDTLNHYFVKGVDYEYVYADAWGEYGVSDGGAFVSNYELTRNGIYLIKQS
jgi:hypothetical protein